MAETARTKASKHQGPGVSLVLDDGTLRTEILIDPANGPKAGTLTESSDVTVAVVDAIGELPAPAGRNLVNLSTRANPAPSHRARSRPQAADPDRERRRVHADRRSGSGRCR